MEIKKALEQLELDFKVEDKPANLISNEICSQAIDVLTNTDKGTLDNADALISLVLYDTLNDKISNEGLLIQFRITRGKLNPIEKMAQLLTSIESSLHQKTNIPTLRSWVRKIQNTHPLVDVQIQNLPLYQSVSEDVGSRYLGYSADTQSLDLEDWRTYKANCFRTNIKLKINSDILENTNVSYKLLNERFIQNISNEFFDERNRRPYKNYSHDYHLTGDASWWSDHICLLQTTIYEKIQLILKDAIRLINYINPINTSITAEKDSIDLIIEGSNVQVNLKGSVIKPIIKAIDEKVIIPIINTARD